MLDLINKVEKQKEVGSYDAPINIKSIEFNNIYFNYEGSNKSILENFLVNSKDEKLMP